MASQKSFELPSGGFSRNHSVNTRVLDGRIRFARYAAVLTLLVLPSVPMLAQNKAYGLSTVESPQGGVNNGPSYMSFVSTISGSGNAQVLASLPGFAGRR